MTLQDVIELGGTSPWMWYLLAVFVATPGLALVLPRLHGRDQGGQAPYRYVYTGLIYLVSVPGMLAAVIVAYMLFVSRQDLMQLNVVTTLVPIVSVVSTLMIIGRNVKFDEIPGFDRLSGLFVMVGVTFALVLIIEKTHIMVFFFSSFSTLVLLVVGLFVLLKWGSYAVFRRRDEPKQNPPSLPGA